MNIVIFMIYIIHAQNLIFDKNIIVKTFLYVKNIKISFQAQ
jgi:hypothetical protein